MRLGDPLRGRAHRPIPKVSATVGRWPGNESNCQAPSFLARQSFSGPLLKRGSSIQSCATRPSFRRRTRSGCRRRSRATWRPRRGSTRPASAARARRPPGSWPGRTGWRRGRLPPRPRARSPRARPLPAPQRRDRSRAALCRPRSRRPGRGAPGPDGRRDRDPDAAPEVLQQRVPSGPTWRRSTQAAYPPAPMAVASTTTTATSPLFCLRWRRSRAPVTSSLDPEGGLGLPRVDHEDRDVGDASARCRRPVRPVCRRSSSPCVEHLAEPAGRDGTEDLAGPLEEPLSALQSGIVDVHGGWVLGA